MDIKGSLPALILHVLSRGPNYGYRIAQEIKQRSSGVLDFREGTLYPTLHSLELKGLVESYAEAGDGRTRRFYKLTRSGRAVLAREREDWSRYANAVSGILAEAR